MSAANRADLQNEILLARACSNGYRHSMSSQMRYQSENILSEGDSSSWEERSHLSAPGMGDTFWKSSSCRFSILFITSSGVRGIPVYSTTNRAASSPGRPITPFFSCEVIFRSVRRVHVRYRGAHTSQVTSFPYLEQSQRPLQLVIEYSPYGANSSLVTEGVPLASTCRSRLTYLPRV